MSRTFLLLFAIALGIITARSADDHAAKLYPSPFPPGSVVRVNELLKGANHSFDAADLETVILIRYLGYDCSHCVRQLTYLNEYAGDLRSLGITVVAFSNDDEQTTARLVEKMGYETDVIRIVSDVDNMAAKTIGALSVQDETPVDLHAAMVIHNGSVVMSVLADEPYMNINRLVGEARNAMRKGQGQHADDVQQDGSHAIDAYLTRPSTISVIAGPADNVRGPVDLDFDKSPLHPHDLWVVNSDELGYRMAIIHNATSNDRIIDIRKDSRASHFMWRTMAIAMGDNGALCTAQNGERGDFDPFYQFMGPTLWSSDTAVFARLNQDSRTLLGSHLDMLHQSPNLYGVAFDHDNVYWVSDGYYGEVARYDFQDPHEIGGHDHSDGIVRKYPEAKITPGERGRPAHIDLDDDKRWLYVVDPGSNTILRLDTRSGSFAKDLVPPDESYENHQEYSSFEQVVVETVITSGIDEPVGIDVIGDRLLVGDRKSGAIHIYRIGETTVDPLGVLQTGADELLGIVVGPDMRIWFVDRMRSTINRIDLEAQPTLAAKRDVQVFGQTAKIEFDFDAQTTTSRDAAFTVVMTPMSANGSAMPDTVDQQVVIEVLPGTVADLDVDVAPTDTTISYRVDVIEDDGTSFGGVRAHTIIVPRSSRRVIVDDVLTETYRITPAVEQTGREDYLSLRSDVFLRIADSLSALELVVWNTGSFGDVSTIDDAVIRSLINNDVEIFLIGDDPLLMRSNLPGSINFFSSFGASLRGVDEVVNDNGQRVFQGIPGDTITGGMTNIDFQLPALEHDRGGYFVPNILFRVSGGDAHAILVRDNATRIGAIRNEREYRRSVILGINISRFLEGQQRTEFLDRTLTWLENAPREVVIDTTTSVNDDVMKGATLSLAINGNPAVVRTTVVLTGIDQQVDVGLYTVSGQRIDNLWNGDVSGDVVIPVDVERLSRGTYFIIGRSERQLVHASFVKQ